MNKELAENILLFMQQTEYLFEGSSHRKELKEYIEILEEIVWGEE